jgi:7-dehydrocholesterol reductase
MAVNVGLQLLYILRFFHWEDGYFNSLDITHDRFGFYILWGVSAWLPSIYTSHSLYLVHHPSDMPLPVAVAIALVGIAALWINYQADAQRQRVRQTEGRTTIWGRRPEVIVAHYVAADGRRRRSLLLTSGWWGVARHFHYVPEILLAIAWTAPVGFDHFLPWFYVVYLTCLLVDRTGRDDRRCATKYGESWSAYRQRVPYRMIPGLY